MASKSYTLLEYLVSMEKMLKDNNNKVNNVVTECNNILTQVNNLMIQADNLIDKSNNLVEQFGEIPTEITEARGGETNLNTRLNSITDIFKTVNDNINYEFNNIDTLLNAINNKKLTITFWGDSITEGWDYITDNMLYYNIYVNEIKKAFPTVNIIVNNRGIGGAMIENAIDDNYVSGTNFAKTWATETGKSWKQYVKDTAPDLLFVAFGMNAQNNDTLGSNAVKNLITFVNGFDKKPTIIFMTNFLPRESWVSTTSTGAYSKRIESQRYTRNIVNDYTKTILDDKITIQSTKDNSYNISLFDIGGLYNKLYLGYSDNITMCKAYRGGVDYSHPELLQKGIQYDLLNNANNFELRCKINYSNNTNNVFGLTCRNGLTILINSNGTIGVYKGSTLLSEKTRSPFMTTNLKIKVVNDLVEIYFSDFIQMRFINNDCVGNGRVYMACDLKPVAINNLVVVDYEPIKTKGVINEDFAVGNYSNGVIETKYPYGGNGVNHPTSALVELIYTPFIKKFINYIKSKI